MELFFCEGLPDNSILDPQESHHAIRVLRKKTGDTLSVTDGKGNLYHCIVAEANPRRCTIKTETKETFPKQDPFIHIAIAPTKNIDRTNWFIEKATEIGVNKITFLHTAHSERIKLNLEKAQAKAISALKQSQQFWLPEISGLHSLSELLNSIEDQKFIAHLEKDNPVNLSNVATEGKSSIILIGPEGDFSEEEIAMVLNNQFRMVALGKTRLRTETAGIVAAALLRSSS